MSVPLMPKATAVWLIENTALTFEQIADFCGMHVLEVQGIADGEVAEGIVGQNPITASQVSREEIERCEKNPQSCLNLSQSATTFQKIAKKSKKTGRYTPVARRQDKPDAIAWIIKHCPDLSDSQISKLIGTTKNTIGSVRTRSHWNWSNITPKDPVLLGLCSQTELDNAIFKSKKPTPDAASSS